MTKHQNSNEEGCSCVHCLEDRRLDSWKEIAAYLKRDVRTVQRWEKREGLPVHRHVHDKLSSVYAYRFELDAWWNGDSTVMLVPNSSGNGSRPPHNKLSLAVLFFDNLSNDVSLDWLRVSLADILITGLSQSPHVDVLGMDCLYRIFAELGRTNGLVASAEAVQFVAQSADVETVFVGSFIKLDETFRVNVRARLANTGRILKAYKVDGVGLSSILPMMDNLTRRICTDIKLSTSSEKAAFPFRLKLDSSDR